MVDTDDTRRTTDDGRRTTPRVWHKLPTGELKNNKFTKTLFDKIRKSGGLNPKHQRGSPEKNH